MTLLRALFTVLLMCVSTAAFSGTVVSSNQLVPVGYCQLTSLSASVLLTSCSGGIPTTAQIIIAIPETQAVRWRDDSTAPTGSVGMPLAIGAALAYQGDLTKIQFIEQTASAKLNVAFYRYQ